MDPVSPVLVIDAGLLRWLCDEIVWRAWGLNPAWIGLDRRYG